MSVSPASRSADGLDVIAGSAAQNGVSQSNRETIQVSSPLKSDSGLVSVSDPKLTLRVLLHNCRVHGTIEGSRGLCCALHTRVELHAFDVVVARWSSDTLDPAPCTLHSPFLKAGRSARLLTLKLPSKARRSLMDQLDWVIIAVGAFVSLVVAVSAWESEKRLERIIKLLERQP